MKKIQSGKILIFTLFFVLNLLITNKVFAATIILNSSKNTLGMEEQFYVDIMLNPEEQSINAISGSLYYKDENLTFIRAEEGKSMVNLWIEKPKLDGNKISFAGLIPNGFDGVIDPFNPKYKLPGLIIRLVFEAKKSGNQVEFSTSTISLNLNDGQGTEIEAPSAYSFINISNNIVHIKYETINDDKPELEAYVTRDSNIYNNKYILIFNATDKETGIKSVKIKEGNRDWKEIESPYLLEDQSRHSLINLQAINFGGTSIILNIDKVPYSRESIIKTIIIIFIIFLFILIISKKIYAKSK